jgi:hypothetical protein
MDVHHTRQRWPRRAAHAAAAAALALVLAACAPGTGVFDVRVTFDVTPVVRAGILVVTVPAERPAGGITVRRSDAPSFRIPPGHYPPRGQCRIWVPNRPPGLQSPPGACSDLERRVPAGAYLVYG